MLTSGDRDPLSPAMKLELRGSASPELRPFFFVAGPVDKLLGTLGSTTPRTTTETTYAKEKACDSNSFEAHINDAN